MNSSIISKNDFNNKRKYYYKEKGFPDYDEKE